MGAREQRPTAPPALRSFPEPGTIILVLTGPVERADVQGLCEHARRIIETHDAALVVCDVGALADPDAVTVDALARLQLLARRLGRRLGLRHACVELQELLVFMGLRDVVALCAPSWLEPRGQAEEREQACRVEKETDPADPAV